MDIPQLLQPFLDMQALERINEIVSDLDYNAMYDLLELLDMRRALERKPDDTVGQGGYRDPTSEEGIELRAYLSAVLKEYPLDDRDRLVLFLHFAVRDQIVPGLDAARIRHLADVVRRFHAPKGGGGSSEGGHPFGQDPSMN